jgi:adenine-specific DNA-methyltransferase
LSYKIDFKEFDKNAAEFEQLNFEDQKKFLLEVLDKNQLYVNYCDFNDTDYKVSDEDKKLNKLFYEG